MGANTPPIEIRGNVITGKSDAKIITSWNRPKPPPKFRYIPQPFRFFMSKKFRCQYCQKVKNRFWTDRGETCNYCTDCYLKYVERDLYENP